MTPSKLSIPTSTPESAGISSDAILRVIKGLDANRLPMHALLILRHGKLAGEFYWKPYCRERKHRYYSTSKSLVSLAVGIMADENKLSLNDPVYKYFPEYMKEDANEYLKRATIRDMLMMADCHAGFSNTLEEEWITSWFETTATHPPGAVFAYNTCCTNLCNAIVEKIAGISFIDYLYPRLLEPIGASKDITCILSPNGYSYGGSGVLATPMDMALIAQLCLNKGRWQGKQLISEKYINEATSSQIDNWVMNDEIDSQQGYGYQIWRTRHNGYKFYGMGSQYAICLPDYELVVVTMADTQGYTNAGFIIHELIYNEILPTLSVHPLPENPAGQESLNAYASALTLPLVQGEPISPTAARVSGVTYGFKENPMNIKTARFDFNSDEVAMTYEKPNGIHTLRFGIGKLIKQSFPETHYSGKTFGVSAGYGYESRAGAAWAKENCLAAKVYITDDYLGSFKMTAVFSGDELIIQMSKIAEDFLHDYQGTAKGKILL
jgi:CubicO group peptidase (beta-lactamase class C family)